MQGVEMGAVERIVKDALKAILFLAIAGALLIYFLGYIGVLATEVLGLIFLVCFIAVRFTEIAAFVMSKSHSRQPPPPPFAPPPAAAPPELKYCPKCGSAWVSGARSCANCG
jgi:hypothetical protein